MGFSTYEARAYIGLLKQNPVTGYALSKISGVPRSRIYETLDRLISRGYAMAIRTDPVEYSPLAAKELIVQLQEQFDGAISTLDTELQQFTAVLPGESIWNLRGREAIMQRIHSMIHNARSSVYIVGWGEVLQDLRLDLEMADQRGVRTVVISCGEFEISSGKHYRHAFERELVSTCDSSINITVDGKEVLIGQTQPVETCEAAWSHSQALIEVSEEYIRHEVYLHKIIKRLGETQADSLREALMEGLQEVPHS